MPQTLGPSPARVLVVAGEALPLHSVREFLTGAAPRIAGIANTAAEAVEAAHRLLPDLILADVSFHEAALQIYNQHSIPAIFVAAESDPAAASRAPNPAQFGFLLHPFRRADLLNAI